jgi:hypothetical protein
VSLLARDLPPSVGVPVPVQVDGTIRLPWIEPVAVQGKTLAEAEELVRRAYVERTLLKAGRERVQVTLMQPRANHVTVIRQESGGFTTAGLGAGIIGTSTKRGTGHVLELPAYQSDVLTAVAQTGGLAGLDAYNTIFIFKGAGGDPGLTGQLENLPPGQSPAALPGFAGRVVEIPVRLPPGAPPPFKPADVVLDNGDVVFIEARDVELFYAGGLLPAGEYVLPRDYNLDVVRAVALLKGPMVNGAFAVSNLSGALLAPGVGNPSPSQLTVIRQTPSGATVPIRVDLNRALVDARERILVQPGDVLILQESADEALARYLTETFFNFSLSWELIHSRHALGVVDVSTPERIPGRIGVSTQQTVSP